MEVFSLAREFGITPWTSIQKQSGEIIYLEKRRCFLFWEKFQKRNEKYMRMQMFLLVFGSNIRKFQKDALDLFLIIFQFQKK